MAEEVRAASLAWPADARVLFVQYGDFAAAADRFARGEGETYYAQQYSVQVVQQMREHVADVAVLFGGQASDEQRTPGDVLTSGVAGGLYEPAAQQIALQWADTFAPTHLVLRTPEPAFVQWAARREVQTLIILADSFQRSWRHWRRHRRLANCLNSDAVDWIGNHNVPASQNLADIGVDRSKIIPWDWPLAVKPGERPARTRDRQSPPIVLFAGQVKVAKGVTDLLDAAAKLATGGLDLRVRIAGDGDLDTIRARVRSRGDRVEFLGRITHDRVLQEMRDATVVIVPSRRNYPEGLPMTIYDTLGQRTPLIVSDHPMFVERLVDGRDALVFKAGDPASLAATLRRLLEDDALYATLSQQAADALARLSCPTQWGDLVNRWLAGDREWLAARTLAAMNP